MSMYAAALLGITQLTKKKESPIEPFKRTAVLADEEQKRAYVDLECAMEELTRAIEEKSK